MSKLHYVIFCLILTSILFLVSCGNGKVTYQEGFPAKDSPGLMEFMRYSILKSQGKFLFQDMGNNIYASFNTNSDPKSLQYFEYTDDQLKAQYESLLKTNDSKVTFKNLILGDEAITNLRNAVGNDGKKILPAITINNDNKLEIKTLKDEKVMDLPIVLKDFNIESTDDLIINVEAVNNSHIQLEIQTVSPEGTVDKSLGLFIKQDLTDFVVTDLSWAEFQKTLSTGQLKEYLDLFPETDSKGEYLEIFEGYEVLNTETNKVIRIEKPDYLSKDGKYIYLNGKEEKISDGNQQIQTIENYMEGNEVYESEFKISYKKIAKEAGLKTSGVSIAKIVYSNEDYVVLALNYKAFIVGDAGYTNVIIDLQKDKDNPTVYVVDLGIH